MPNIIAVVWDFDKTLVDGYMQDPMFEEYSVNSSEFWKEVNALPKKYEQEQGVRVNRDTIYLNLVLKYVREGKFKDLSNEKLNQLGDKILFYKGIPEFFEKTVALVSQNDKYREYDIKLEHYVVSTGIAQMIHGSKIARLVDDIWGCEFIEEENADGEKQISEIVYTIDNTTKTRALFEINKGVGQRDGVEVNSKLTPEMRRVPFKNMIYIADGPSDIPAFSLVNKMGGATFAVYKKGCKMSFAQAEMLRDEGRVQMYSEADYSEDSQAYMWITSKIQQFADKIVQEEKDKISKVLNPTPQHIV